MVWGVISFDIFWTEVQAILANSLGSVRDPRRCHGTYKTPAATAGTYNNYNHALQQ